MPVGSSRSSKRTPSMETVLSWRSRRVGSFKQSWSWPGAGLGHCFPEPNHSSASSRVRTTLVFQPVNSAPISSHIRAMP